MKNNAFIRDKAYFNGKWHSASDNSEIEVSNPANGETIGHVPLLTAQQIDEAIAQASKAQKAWKALPAKTRSNLLYDWYQAIMDNQEALAELMTLEQGKPLAEAKGEVAYAAAYVQWFAEEAKRVYGDIIPGHLDDKRLLVLKQPVGVVAAITPWNFPLAMITRKAAPALAVGCTFLVKPAMETPLSALALAELADQVGIMPGVFNVLTGDAEQIGQQFCSSQTVRKLSFTGSTRTGKILMRQCIDDVKKVSMELGGNAPFIVFDDANVTEAVAGAIASKYRNSGQTCVCADRFYVQSGIYDEFVKQFKSAVTQLNIGNGLDDNVHIGPLINTKTVESIQARVDEAVAQGAEIAMGGKASELGHSFYEPTILTNVQPDMRIFQEETFGPVASIVKFDNEDDVLTLANQSRYGLAGYFYSNDINRIFRVAEQLEVGMVGANTGLISTEMAPFGGVKESGVGREGSKYGIDDYIEMKYLCIQVQPSSSN